MRILQLRTACGVTGIVFLAAALGPTFAAGVMVERYVPDATDLAIIVDCFRTTGVLSIGLAVLLLALWRTPLPSSAHRKMSSAVLLALAASLAVHVLSAFLTGPSAETSGTRWSGAVYGDVGFFAVLTTYWVLVTLSGSRREERTDEQEAGRV